MEVSTLKDTNTQLLTQIRDLNAQIATQEKDYANLKEQYATKEQQLENIKLKVTTFENTIREKLAWFADNSNLKLHANQYNSIRNSEAINIKEECRINLVQIAYLNENTFGLSYQHDNIGEELKGIDKMLRERGGDCEDFSQLFIAEYNTLVEKCVNSGFDRNYIMIEAMKEREGGIYVLTENANSIIYYPDMAPVRVSNVGNYMYGVCYINSTESGHCVVGLFSKIVKSDKDIDYLLDNDVRLIEPQSGEYVGNVDGTISKQDIDIIITDQDIFVRDNSQWVGYSSFLGKV